MTTEATEREQEMSPAQKAWFDYRKDYGSWHLPEIIHRHSSFVAGYEAALEAATPRTITTAEELDALGVGSVVRCPDKTPGWPAVIAEKVSGSRDDGYVWDLPGDDFGCTSKQLQLPATVLHDGGAA